MSERLFDALIVIDVQQALVDGHPSKEDSFLVAVGAMIDACRRADVPVLYVCHEERAMSWNVGRMAGGCIAPSRRRLEK